MTEEELAEIFGKEVDYSKENNTVTIDFADFEYLDYGTDSEGNVVSLTFTVKI